MQRLSPSVFFLPARQLLGHEVHKDDVAVGVASNDRVADTANCCRQPLFAGIGLFNPLFDLPDLMVVGSSEFAEDSPRLPCEQGRDQGSDADKSDSGVAVNLDVVGGAFGSASGN